MIQNYQFLLYAGDCEGKTLQQNINNYAKWIELVLKTSSRL